MNFLRSIFLSLVAADFSLRYRNCSVATLWQRVFVLTGVRTLPFASRSPGSGSVGLAATDLSSDEVELVYLHRGHIHQNPILGAEFSFFSHQLHVGESFQNALSNTHILDG